MEGTAAVTVGDSIVTSFFSYALTIVVSLAAAVLIWAVVQVLEAMQAKIKAKAAAAAPAAAVSVAVAAQPEPVDETAKHVAAIAAAVYTAIGAHRLIYIGEVDQGVGWKTTGRAIHQTARMIKRSPQKG
ncbi:MAG: hypothetical protein KIT00_00625 [Rhodospirillales bacterium]|nr:hypothetical protein [Rhodospirillales bacterium]